LALPCGGDEGTDVTHQYIDVPGGDHGSGCSIGMPDIFKFFGTHSKPAPR
jgi:hypothetical protein